MKYPTTVWKRILIITEMDITLESFCPPVIPYAHINNSICPTHKIKILILVNRNFQPQS